MAELKKILLLSIIFLYFITVLKGVCFAQVNPGQIERSQEIIQDEEALRNRIGQEKKFLIKKIIVEGADLLAPEEIKKMTLAYENHWLSKSDIQAIIDLLKTAYREKGYPQQPRKTAFRIKNNTLKIHVLEDK
ncbi:MAG: POTRA domain-containing protein [Candidatus Omnitrophica bacterium]|nr:POTRA domain-containing protein [Candidatus Omnitrophota bacterium]MDD5592593.1 POTRA domain-containing protein [Candidatus Omnitrophota bacterium]